MDIAAVRAALRSTVPAPRAAAEDGAPDVAGNQAVAAALRALDVAVRRSERAESELAVALRASTLKASLKAAVALDRARATAQAELGLCG